MAAIEVEQLTVRHGDRAVVDGLRLAAFPGEVVALLGPNGAGKTTTVETLEGYRRPSAGCVRVLGLDPVRDHRRLVPRIGVMLQSGGVYPAMTARRALSLFASYYENPRPPEELLTLLGLEEVSTTPFKRLSGGERQRLLLALALVGRPEVVFLDEPTAGVDPAGRIAVRDVIAGLRDRGVAVLLASHELDEVERLADRVAIIDHGRLVAEGAPGEVGGGDELVRFRVNVPLPPEALGAALGCAVEQDGPLAYRLSAASPAVVADLTRFIAESGVALVDLRVGRERLEEVFLRLVAEEEKKR